MDHPQSAFIEEVNDENLSVPPVPLPVPNQSAMPLPNKSTTLTSSTTLDLLDHRFHHPLDDPNEDLDTPDSNDNSLPIPW